MVKKDDITRESLGTKKLKMKDDKRSSGVKG